MKEFMNPEMRKLIFAPKDIITASTEVRPSGGGETPSIFTPNDPLFKAAQNPEENP